KNQFRTVEVDKWIQSYLIDNLARIEDKGLLTGKTGILALLYDKGYKEVVTNELRDIIENIDENNISLRSGPSGIGLFVISLYLKTENIEYLHLAESLAKLIELNRIKGAPLKIKDRMADDIGVIDGLSGVALLHSALNSATNDKQYIDKAEVLLKEDLGKTKNDNATGVLPTLDNKRRLLAYLSGGSVGTAISVWFVHHVSGQLVDRED